MPDLTGVFWTRITGHPRKLGTFVITDREFRASYVREAADLPPMALALPPSAFTTTAYVHDRNEILEYPAFIWAKIPQTPTGGATRNVQRLIYTRAILASGRSPAPGIETDYEILMMAGRDGIGHVDVFRSDEAAQQFYASRKRALRRPIKIAAGDDLWDLVRKAVSDAAGDNAAVDAVMAAVGPTPSLQGMIPKLALAVPDAEIWDGRASSPGALHFDGEPFVDAIVKIEPGLYPGIVALEDLAYQIHEELGFSTPRRWRHTTTSGVRLLAIERFDRVDGNPVPMESLFSVLSLLGGRSNPVMSPLEGSYALVARALALPDPAVTTDRGDSAEFFRRLIVSLLTGNGDMHLENIAILGKPSHRKLSPVFDPAPMRAYYQHTQVSAVRWFRDDAGLRNGIPSNIGDRIVRFGEICGLKLSEITETVRNILTGTQDYLDRVQALEDVPAGTKQTLKDAVDGIRYRIERQFGAPPPKQPLPATAQEDE